MILRIYKTAYSNISRNSWYLCLVMLINRMGAMVVPFMSIYFIKELHFSVIKAGYIFSFYGLGSICGAYFGGKILDKFGFYYLQFFSLMIGGVIFLILGSLKSFYAVSLFTFFLSICNESFRPANSLAIFFYSTNDNLARSSALNRLAINVGWSFGGGIGGLIASTNYRALFWVDGITNILAGIVLVILLPRPQNKPTLEKTLFISAYNDKVYLVFIFLTSIYAICFIQYTFMQSVFYKLQWGLNEAVIGYLMTFNGCLVILFEMIIVTYFYNRNKYISYMIMGLFLTLISFILLNTLSHEYWSALVITSFIAFGEMFCVPFMNAFGINRCSLNGRGSYAGLFSICWSFAQVVGPLIFTNVLNNGGFENIWWLSCFMIILSILGFLLLQKHLSTEQWPKL